MVAILGIGVLVALCVARREDLLDVAAAVPPEALVGLAALHLLGLVARSEAWRLSLAALLVARAVASREATRGLAVLAALGVFGLFPLGPSAPAGGSSSSAAERGRWPRAWP
jgi:hypothetical protein